MPPKRVYWEAILMDEGMPAEPRPVPSEYRLSLLGGDEGTFRANGRLRQLVVRVHQRAGDVAAYDAVVRPYLHTTRWRRFPAVHRRVWMLHVDLIPVRDIAEQVGISRMRAQRIIASHLARAKQRAGV